MSKEFILPDLGEGVESAKIVDLLVKVGEKFEEDQVVLEVETDKATVEVPSDEAGTVEEVLVEKGSDVKVGTVVFRYK
ncbi:MAG: hypothetical protein JEY94_19055 [Melioribacteraceae bacterium]|nr:hypothetical protein [Melioribacteraceae bacterium]